MVWGHPPACGGLRHPRVECPGVCRGPGGRHTCEVSWRAERQSGSPREGGGRLWIGRIGQGGPVHQGGSSILSNCRGSRRSGAQQNVSRAPTVKGRGRGGGGLEGCIPRSWPNCAGPWVAKESGLVRLSRKDPRRSPRKRAT